MIRRMKKKWFKFEFTVIVRNFQNISSFNSGILCQR